MDEWPRVAPVSSVEELCRQASALAATGEPFELHAAFQLTVEGRPALSNLGLLMVLDHVKTLGYSSGPMSTAPSFEELMERGLTLRFVPGRDDGPSTSSLPVDVKVVASPDVDAPVEVVWARRVGCIEAIAAFDGVLYVVDEGTWALDISTGDVNWWHEVNNEMDSASGGVEVGVSGDCVQINAPGEYFVELDRLTGRHVRSRPRTPKSFHALSTPVATNCRVADDHSVVAGPRQRPTWHIPLDQPPQADTLTPLAVDDLTVVAMADCRVIALRIGPER